MDLAFAARETAAANAFNFDANLAGGVQQGGTVRHAAAAAAGHEDNEGVAIGRVVV
jgi:hypothetical protein